MHAAPTHNGPFVCAVWGDDSAQDAVGCVTAIALLPYNS